MDMDYAKVTIRPKGNKGILFLNILYSMDKSNIPFRKLINRR